MPVITQDRYLKVNGVPLATPAWHTETLAPLLDAGAFRGSDRQISGVDGEKPFPRRRGSWHVVLNLFVKGYRDSDGVVIADPFAGLEANLDYLIANVLTPNVAAADGMWDIVLHRADGTERSAPGTIVPPFAPVPWGFCVVKGTLDLIIPSGILV